MTYSRSLQGRFASWKYTPLLLVLLAALLWGAALFLMPAPSHVLWISIGGFLPVVLPVLCYIAVALLLARLHLSERRVYWMAPLYLLLTAITVTCHYNATVAASTLLFMLLMSSLLSCQPGENARGALFSAFALLCLFSFLQPQFLFLLPLFVVYMLVVNLTGAREWLSALLGLLMPFWFLFGLQYVWPSLAGYLPTLKELAAQLSFPSLAGITPVRVLSSVAELGIMLPAIVLFAGSSVPGKPYLRKRLLFVMLANSLLFVLSWMSGPGYGMLFAWRVPGIALLASYLFTLKITRLSNIYFIVAILFWLAIAILDIWMK